MKQRQLKGVLIGAGYFAGFQAEAWRRMNCVTLAAVADPVPDKARAFADRHGIAAAYDDAAEMLRRERPDFVDIATRPETHLELTRLAAECGAHVICQKPMAPRWNECLQMVDACEGRRVRLLIHENWRWQPWYREVRRRLDRADLGSLFQISFQWRTGDGRGVDPYQTQPYFRQMPQLLIYETLVHILDTYRYLVGEAERLHCQASRINPAITGEDQVLMLLEFENGISGLIDANRITGPFPAPVAMGTLLLEGELGTLRVAPDGRIWHAENGGAEQAVAFEPAPAGYKGDSVFATQEHLARCLIEGAPAESEGREYLKTVELVEAAYASVRTGNAMRLPYLL